MPERGLFLYRGEGGQTNYISFEKGSTGVPIESLLPPSGRGSGFANFKIAEYLTLAELLLVSPDDFAQVGKKQSIKNASAAQPAKVQLPLDLDYLKLRQPDGQIDPARTAELFEVVQAYWTAEPNSLGVAPGYVAYLWHEGQSPDAIIAFMKSVTGPDGQAHPPEPRKVQPGEQLIMELATPPGASILDPRRLEQILLWTRTHRLEDPEYQDPDAVRGDLRHLGFFTEQGELNEDVVATARTWLHDHWQEEPHYPRLWRHLQAVAGTVQPEPKGPDYTEYSEQLARLLDADSNNVEIAQAVLAMDAERLDVPSGQLCQAARLETIKRLLPATAHAMAEEQFNQKPFGWYAPDNVAWALRKMFQDRSYGLGSTEIDAWIADQGKPGLVRQLNAAFGQRDKWQTLRDLGLLDADGRWSEIGFQREQAMIRKINAEGGKPGLERLRWELHRQYRPDDSIPLAWALMNDFLPRATITRAQRLASVALSGGMLGQKVDVKDTVTVAEYRQLRQVGSWLHGADALKNWSGLGWLGLMSAQEDINWRNWEQVCSFVYDKLDQPPEPELIKDWLKGVVTFEGLGRYRAQNQAAKPFKGTTKTGRNDPCPCGSGKKHKKCCGR